MHTEKGGGAEKRKLTQVSASALRLRAPPPQFQGVRAHFDPVASGRLRPRTHAERLSQGSVAASQTQTSPRSPRQGAVEPFAVIRVGVALDSLVI